MHPLIVSIKLTCSETSITRHQYVGSPRDMSFRCSNHQSFRRSCKKDHISFFSEQLVQPPYLFSYEIKVQQKFDMDSHGYVNQKRIYRSMLIRMIPVENNIWHLGCNCYENAVSI